MALPGVKEAQVDFSKKIATVTVEKGKALTVEQVSAALQGSRFTFTELR